LLIDAAFASPKVPAQWIAVIRLAARRAGESVRRAARGMIAIGVIASFDD
jgi:hypothetical protein